MKRDPPTDSPISVRRRLLQYLLALAAVSIGILLRLMLAQELGAELPFITLFPALFLVASLFGLGPTLVATAAGLLATLRVFPGGSSSIGSIPLTSSPRRNVTRFWRSW